MDSSAQPMVFYDHAAPSESSSTGTPLSEYAWSSSEGYASTASLSPTTPDAEPADSYFRPVVRSDEAPIVAVMGVGYVGLHLVTEFATQYKVVAYDVNAKRLAQLTEEYKSRSNIYFTNDASKLQAATHFLVAVPTPLFPGTTETDTRIIRSALGTICENVRPGATVVIESSVSVGMTRALLGDMVRTYGLKAGMSPERVDPGRVEPPYHSIPKIISGLDSVAPGSLSSITTLYSRIFSHLVPVSAPEVAEMTKLYENCQRMVLITYANEMADACASLPTGPIDPLEVSRAAATKPFGYLPMMPSAGVGGHCIPVNPGYLFSLGENIFPLLRQATETTRLRPRRLADKAMHELDSRPKRREGKRRVLVVGAAFKPGQELTTNAPALAMLEHIDSEWSDEVDVSYADPLVTELPRDAPRVARLDDAKHWSVSDLNEFDAVLCVIKQHGLDLNILDQLSEEVMVVKY